MWDLPTYQDDVGDFVIAKHFNNVSGELKKVIRLANLELDEVSSIQLVESIERYSRSGFYKTYGTNNAIILKKDVYGDVGFDTDKLFDGFSAMFRANFNNSDAVTIKINENTEYPVLLRTKPLVGGDIEQGDTFLIKFEDSIKKFHIQLLGYDIGSREKIIRANYDALVQKVDLGLVPAGAIFNFAVNREIDGYFICDGREFVGSDYPLLARHFDPYRPPSRRRMRIPDLGGLFIRGLDPSRGDGEKSPGRADNVPELDKGRIHASIQADGVRQHVHMLGRVTFKRGTDEFSQFTRADFTNNIAGVAHEITVLPENFTDTYDQLDKRGETGAGQYTNSNLAPPGDTIAGRIESRPVNIAYHFYIRHGN